MFAWFVLVVASKKLASENGRSIVVATAAINGEYIEGNQLSDGRATNAR
jgi:hypothetical protein